MLTAKEKSTTLLIVQKYRNFFNRFIEKLWRTLPLPLPPAEADAEA